jgi:hypothetical protein
MPNNGRKGMLIALAGRGGEGSIRLFRSTVCRIFAVKRRKEAQSHGSQISILHCIHAGFARLCKTVQNRENGIFNLEDRCSIH